MGKTSLAVTAGNIYANGGSEKNFIYIPCGHKTSFFEVISAIGNSIVDVQKRIGPQGGGLNLNLSAPGLGGLGIGKTPGVSSGLPVPTTMSEAIDYLRYVRANLVGQIVVAIDELDRVESKSEKNLFAELLKNVSSQVEDVRFMLCGIGANVDEVLGQHLSTGRMFEPVEVDKLSSDKLWSIIEEACTPLGVAVDKGYLLRIGVISDGFPHYVHLMGECLIYAMFDDDRDVVNCERSHFDVALKEALKKAEPSLRGIYQTGHLQELDFWFGE